MKIIFIIIVGLIVLLAIFWPSIEKHNKEYNKYMCATQGMREDCKTPLPTSERLK